MTRPEGDGGADQEQVALEGEHVQLRVDVLAVTKFAKDRFWEDIGDKNAEDRTIEEIEAGTEEGFGRAEEDQFGGGAWDDVRDKQMAVGKVREECHEEVEYMMRKGCWKYLDIQEC